VSEPQSDREWVDLYVDQRDVYDAFVGRLEDLVESLLDDGDVSYDWVITFSRTPHDVGDQLARARRAGRTFERPLESELRVAGVMIGVRNNSSAADINDVIRREFTVDDESSLPIDEAAVRNERLVDESSRPVGYEFAHYLVSLDERRSELAEWSRFVGLKARIEVRTLLQDAWAGVDDGLPFYEAESYPSEVRELLTGAAARIAAADEQLTEVHHAIWRLYREYSEAIAAGDLQIGVNGVSLMAYVENSELVSSLTELGVDVGLGQDPGYETGWQSIESGILWLLRRDDVHTIAELEAFLKQATPRARVTLADLHRVVSDRDFIPWAIPEEIVEWLWLILRRADADTISLLSYRTELEYALNTLIGNPMPADELEVT
jgi:ppGpp synthetase/RelA/SpoT-type nucleotidyltranferase